METVKSRILILATCYISCLTGAEGIGASAVHALLDDPDSLCVVKECRELEGTYGLSCSHDILRDAGSIYTPV